MELTLQQLWWASCSLVRNGRLPSQRWFERPSEMGCLLGCHDISHGGRTGCNAVIFERNLLILDYCKWLKNFQWRRVLTLLMVNSCCRKRPKVITINGSYYTPEGKDGNWKLPSWKRTYPFAFCQGTFEDDVPFPKMGYVRSQKGTPKGTGKFFEINILGKLF